jgi:hypothetical protein
MTHAWLELPDGTQVPMNATIRPDSEEGLVMFLEPLLPEWEEEDESA